MDGGVLFWDFGSFYYCCGDCVADDDIVWGVKMTDSDILEDEYLSKFKGILGKTYFKTNEEYLEIARSVSAISNHPEHKVGAILLNSAGIEIARGWNWQPNIPQGLPDIPSVHAEVNVFLNLMSDGCSIDSPHTLVVSAPPCERCAAFIVKIGIKKVIHSPMSRAMMGRWVNSASRGRILMKYYGVEVAGELSVSAYDPEDETEED